jgi:hypothetical protein
MQPTDAQLDALRRLWAFANEDDLDEVAPRKAVAGFLLSLYNGSRFPFALTELRFLDDSTFEDCLLVLRMDHRPNQEVHNHLGLACVEFEDPLTEAYGIVDQRKTRASS